MLVIAGSQKMYGACQFAALGAYRIGAGLVRVLTTEEAAAETVQPGQETVESSRDGRVDINTADASALMSLPGIGQSKADAIIAYRNEHGTFKAPEELMNISGIKEGVYQKIKDSIKVN